jgi:hypothetical protein
MKMKPFCNEHWRMRGGCPAFCEWLVEKHNIEIPREFKCPICFDVIDFNDRLLLMQQLMHVVLPTARNVLVRGLHRVTQPVQ